MTQRFYDIAAIGSGRIVIGPRPQSETLAQWCEEAAIEGIGHVVSLIGPVEVERYGLADEAAALMRQGIAFTHFPVEDFDTPGMSAMRDLVGKLHAEISAGRKVMAHCAGGVGRAGTLASCLLVTDGMGPDAAMRLVSKERGVASPETGDQANFIRRFA